MPGSKRQRRSRRRRIYRRVALLVAVLMSPVVYSYAHALNGPGSDSLGARSVEWMRGHHLGGIVNSVERRWYDSHQAKIGGTPDVSMASPHLAASTPMNGGVTSKVTPTSTVAPLSPPATPPTQPTPSSDPTTSLSPPSPPPGAVDPAVSSTTTAPQPPPPQPPAPLQTPATPAVPGEGAWTPIGPTTNGIAGAYGTLIRPDDVHTSVLDAVVWIDPTLLSLRQYPGATIPGAPWDRPDHVEADRQSQLVAAFAGGFRLADSHGGIIVGGTQLAPMRVGAATLAIDVNGVPEIGAWGRDINASTNLDSARQNLDLIVDAGSPVPGLLSDANRKWGFTGPMNKSAVWRSGAGITGSGAFVWVGGPGLSIETLAETLVRAGAIRGMQLDINHEWVELNTYTTSADGAVTGTRILPGMQHSGNRWLTEDTRDFIAVFARASS